MSTPLSYGDLLRMRRDMARLLGGTAVLHRPTLALDGQGGRTETWAAYGTVSFNLAPAGKSQDSENVEGGALRATTPRAATFPATTDITPRDRVVYSGGTFEVASVMEPRPLEVVRRAMLTYIT